MKGRRLVGWTDPDLFMRWTLRLSQNSAAVSTLASSAPSRGWRNVRWEIIKYLTKKLRTEGQISNELELEPTLLHHWGSKLSFSISLSLSLFQMAVHAKQIDWCVIIRLYSILIISSYSPLPLLWCQRDLTLRRSRLFREPSALGWWIQPAQRRLVVKKSCSLFFGVSCMLLVLQQVTSIRHPISNIILTHNLDECETHTSSFYSGLPYYLITSKSITWRKSLRRSTGGERNAIGDHYRCNYTRGGLRGANGMQCRCFARSIHWRMNYLFLILYSLPPPPHHHYWKVSPERPCSGSC
jgi:hypothetical protein